MVNRRGHLGVGIDVGKMALKTLLEVLVLEKTRTQLSDAVWFFLGFSHQEGKDQLLNCFSHLLGSTRYLH